MKFQRKKFFDLFRDKIDSTISQEQVSGIEFLLGQMESDSRWKSIPEISYALATIFHETAGSMQPVEEGYYLGSKTRVKNFQKTLRYYPYFGRGYVQLTWETKKIPNYSKASKALGIDFVKNPDLVMVPKNAYEILTLGMHEGWFTTRKLSHYISDTGKDYKNARKIINGVDRAGLIAGYANQFEDILRASKTSTPAPAIAKQTEHLDKGINETAAQSEGQAPTESKVTQEKGDTIVEVTAKNEQDVNEPVTQAGPRPYNDIGFGETLKNDAKAVLPANGLAQTASEVVQNASGVPEWLIPLIIKLAYLVAIATAFWILYRVGTWLVHTWKENQRVKLQALINTDVARKNIEFVAPEPK